MILSAILLAPSGGCATTTRFVVPRAAPAPLAGVQRPALVFHGPPSRVEAGDLLAAAVAARLREAGLDPAIGAAAGDLEALDGTVQGWIEGLEADGGRMAVRLQVARPREGTVALPQVVVVAPRGTSLEDRIADAAARIAAALLPGPSALETVEWERAGDWDRPARRHMAAGDVPAALAALEDALARATAAAVDAETLAALHYDLGVCLDLLGRAAEAERALDEALTLHGSERHIEALRDLRRRRAGGGP
ncbi:MAG: hypothetical protein M9894_23875 [Planctomycetes bacterium]|nr:hypothetical protein [Planctomycetota bacterium]